MYSIRTDLALEAREMYKQNAQQESEVPGVEVVTEGSKDISVTRVKITSLDGVEAMGKPMGNYITIEVPRLRENDPDLHEEVCKVFAKELFNIVKIDKKATVLVVGLGNWNVTPDALGPKVVSSLMVTRHLLEYIPEQVDEGVRPVCAIAPGVLGLTGIETGEIIRGIVDRVKPDLVIAIDALASRRMDRISTTIQIADTGINPGSGVGNKRMGLTIQTLGVPVIAIGVPTVVDAATMANDTIDLMIDSMLKQVEQGSAFYEMLKNMDKNEKFTLIQEILSPYIGNLMVTPKEVDTIIEDVSKVIANGINIALHEGIGLEDVNRYVH
ncbi:MAG: spore protease [Petroclostridium sp.]|uniref:GPR endopeptidase n=1 Tax=Petroclostridium xylanilyticum TaxID=1792311 RepID=UPI000B99D515|nr:GPR endopeptidase [Petroclostridium xylanilyticum]MBZ4644693.1 endopeptidase [Clostridia bacterium]MDK2811258.1 spore protease [Petroclostridium sp.]